MSVRPAPKRSSLKPLGAYFRPDDLTKVGLSFADLQRLVEAGEVEKIARGLYRRTDIAPNEFETLALVATAARGAIVCLLSALRFHGIGTQTPHEVWIAIGRKARKPSNLPARVRIFRFSGAALTYGVQKHVLLGVPVRVTSPARTVVDCFRYRKKLGIDVALEALRDAFRSRKATLEEIERAADACRARTVIRPYLESLSQ